MCNYRTYEDGTLVNSNLYPEKVEMLYKMKELREALFVHDRLDDFIVEAELVIFEEHGRFMHAWLRSMSTGRRKEILNMEELMCGGRNDYACDAKLQIRALMRDFMKI